MKRRTLLKSVVVALVCPLLPKLKEQPKKARYVRLSENSVDFGKYCGSVIIRIESDLALIVHMEQSEVCDFQDFSQSEMKKGVGKYKVSHRFVRFRYTSDETSVGKVDSFVVAPDLVFGAGESARDSYFGNVILDTKTA